MNFDFTVQTDKKPEQVVNDLENTLKEASFGVLWSFNVKEKLDEKGVGFDSDYYILEVCNPQIAKDALQSTKMAGYFLPCKVVVYENEGQTYIGMPKPTVLMEHVESEDVMRVAEEVEDTLRECFKKAV
ncbi:DUF302 domain-containing protein [Alteribacter natronophilus]|uniref:DUF302 domain-containing protein n=1 Tax=Alteribacter natronophilus TaxID=2583810 RepID=UPI00110DE047|nr:DUF302 domain-containing protein [Alteribacter natronophilus]TMW69893.1 DUF302 domain-containing protein [Alteribacter natronophilus]